MPSLPPADLSPPKKAKVEVMEIEESSDIIYKRAQFEQKVKRARLEALHKQMETDKDKVQIWEIHLTRRCGSGEQGRLPVSLGMSIFETRN